MSHPYERLEAWVATHRLVHAVYVLTRGWPSDERYALVAQVRRAAVSAATCLVEGVTKRVAREFGRYVDISAGSLAEVGYLLRLGGELGYHDLREGEAVERCRVDAARLVGGLARGLRRRQA